MGAMSFVWAEPNFVNLSRTSPLELSSRVSGRSSQTLRLHIGDRVAICVSAICSSQSHLTVPKGLGLKTDGQRKFIWGVLHDQDWERLESVASLVFCESILYGQITNKALSFQTMISPEDVDGMGIHTSPALDLPSRMFSAGSPKRCTHATPSKSDHRKMLLAFNDTISSRVLKSRKVCSMDPTVSVVKKGVSNWLWTLQLASSRWGSTILWTAEVRK
ncbi:hypothetical protein C8R46DRAFT_1249160 [Mycena filopes]|nr:hypothetical protein C8R46DRAFT_1249160 [Mycena filopes]